MNVARFTIPSGYVPGFVCTIHTCNVQKWGFVHYRPSLPGNILFLLIFSVLGLFQLYLGIKYRTGLVCLAMFLGLTAEGSGYIARLLLNADPFFRPYFLWYLICLTLGPVFVAAAIYLCLGRIVMVYGEGISRIRARTYTIIFMGCDVASLFVQAVGGGIAASFPLTNSKMIDLGTHILVAGLSLQVASLFGFSCCSLEFLYRVHQRKAPLNPHFAELYNNRKFKLLLYALGIATITLFIRTVFRSVELSGGFSGKLANSEVQFMILDGTMVIIACTALTVLHPGMVFGKEGWRESRFNFRLRKDTVGEREVESGSGGIGVGEEKGGSNIRNREAAVGQVSD